MILHFPNLDTLRFALTTGAIPDTVRTTATRFGFAEDKSLWIQSSEKLSAVAEKELRRLDVQFPRTSKVELSLEATNWLQMFPLVRDPRAVEVGDKTPVLFELARDSQLAELATEILRLGNDRQSFRWLGDDAETKTLLRVIGPPYYSLLRAIDREGEKDAPIAFREVAPRLWIQVGYTHPLAEHLRPPAWQLMLLRPPHHWICVPEAKLRDIYEVIDFQLPENKPTWNDRVLDSHIQVSVKLTRSGAPEAAELWFLREEGIAQLEDLVRSSDNDLLARLAFAVGSQDNERIVVLRVRPSKNSPPVLVLDGLAMRSYLRIPNLFLPVGMALYPPLRRDAVVKLLAQDKTRITWLVPHKDNTFTPETLPDNAFRPLSEWIDYVLEHEHAAIKTWVGASQFDFEGFVCKDDSDKPKKPKDPSGPKNKKKGADKEENEPIPEAPNITVEKKRSKKADQYAEEEVTASPNELETRLRELEESFAALKTPLDDKDRWPVWLEMAQLNGQLSHQGDAAVCWGNVMWEQSRVQPQWPQTWFRLETRQPIGQTPPIKEMLRILGNDAPGHADLRLLSAHVIWAAALPSPPADLSAHLNRIGQYIEKHESFLGVRVIWLTWNALQQMSGGDVLMLARARDRVLERLFLHGLTPELDLPGFLRFAGMQASNRFRLVRDQVVRLRRTVQDWAKKGTPPPATYAYIDLIFAFGLARLGEITEAQTLRSKAANVLQQGDVIHLWLYEAFAFRIQQALDGKPLLDQLPTQLLQELDSFPGLPEGETSGNLKFGRFKIDRLRENSKILSPHETTETIDSYGRMYGPQYQDELKRELNSLTSVFDRGELIHRLQDLLTGKKKLKDVRKGAVRILTIAIEFAPRLGQSFGEFVLDLVPSQLGKVKQAEEEEAILLEKSLFLAAHYDRKDDVRYFVGQFHQLLQNHSALSHEQLIPLFTHSFRSLRKFGLRDDVTALMQHLEKIVEMDADLQPSSKANTATVASLAASEVQRKRLCLLLELASCWFFFGEDNKARHILNEARDMLYRNELHYINQTKLARSYFTTLVQGSMELALAGIKDFFHKLKGIGDERVMKSHYFLSQLNIVEAMILALISDDFTLDREARKRLDDDEFLVRRRIHRDVREAMAKSGM